MTLYPFHRNHCLTVIAVGCVLATGCSSPLITRSPLGPAYRPTNVYQAGPLPAQIRRVAVLPIALRSSTALLEAGRETLNQVYLEEVAKLKSFDITVVTPAQLQAWTGRGDWKAGDALPHDFFQRLRATTGCDAVIFSELTAYRPYAPLAVGWNLKLIECNKMQTWWAFDEIFDAGKPAVINAAKAYESKDLQESLRTQDEWMVLNSARRFGQYTAYTALGTLPSR